MFQSLERQSSLPIALDPARNKITLTDVLMVGEMSEKRAADMREFTCEPGSSASSGLIYSVYRMLARRSDEAVIRASMLRPDITVIAPGTFKGAREEYFRTAGHYHPLKPGTDIAYPEVYEVLSGRAHWILQKHALGDPSRIEEIYAVEAGPGEKAIMLPGFGHITVNAFPETLVIANWILDGFENDYGSYRQFRGSGYWAFADPSSDAIEFEKNANYSFVAELKKLRPRELPDFGLTRSEPGYTLVRDLSTLDFLKNPEQYTRELTVENCYQVVT